MPSRRHLLWLAPALVGTAQAEPVSPADQAAIRRTIEAQMEAFRRDDGQAAFAFASPMIQGMFGTPANFMAMVRTGYPPVHRPRSVDFTELVEEGGALVQKVELIGPDGRPALALYTMVRGPHGWLIDGCRLVASERPAA
jgi:hypothetical protein